MTTGNSPQWYLRKHAGGEIFGPVSFDQIREWALSAQIHPQDAISNDGRTWNKAPLLAELQMDWLVEVPGQPLYGPTTAETLLEFLSVGEISAETKIINCCTGVAMRMQDAAFFPNPAGLSDDSKSWEAILNKTLQDKILELESAILQKQTELNAALDRIAFLERRVRDLQSVNS
ncbi:MAG: hypothetical protein WCG66_05760 [bacterium]